MKKFKEHIKKETDNLKELRRLLRRMDFNHIVLDSLAQTIVRLDGNHLTLQTLKRKLMYIARISHLNEEMLDSLLYYYPADKYDYNHMYRTLNKAVEKALKKPPLPYEEIANVDGTEEATEVYMKYEESFRVLFK